MASSDRLTGALVSKGQYILTSPNCTFLPDPPLGGDQHLFLQTNLYYGEDDPLQWPQPFLHSHGYLRCIPCGTSMSCDPANIMWHFPECKHFVDDDGIFSGVGKIHITFFYQLKSLSLEPINCAQSKRFKDIVLVTQLSNLLEHLLHHLEFISMSFFMAQLGVWELQPAAGTSGANRAIGL